MQKVFSSDILGGFECSTHINYARRRVDVIAATEHDRFAEQDYRRLLDIGIKTARDGVRWHLIESEPYEYNFSTVLNQVKAAKELGVEIIWDLFHYGFPVDIGIKSAEFVERFTSFSEAFAKFLIEQGETKFFFCPLNEISFFAWMAGDVGGFYPFLKNCGDEIKRNLIRAEIASTRAIRDVCPNARFIHTDPAINITSEAGSPSEIEAAKSRSNSQFHALDALCGRIEPELGGKPEYLDVIGLNYYFDNQWRYQTGRRVFRDDPEYRPFHEILKEYSDRYQRPILIAETGIENEDRADWFRYVCDEVEIARNLGVQVEGVCLYPIVNHPGWDDDRHCHNGLWDYTNSAGEREIYEPLAAEIKRQNNLRIKETSVFENQVLQAKAKAKSA